MTRRARAGAVPYPQMKRLLDLVLVIVSSPVTVPAGILTGFLIRAVDGAPVFFRQRRLGEGNREFTVLKFRTMCEAAGSQTADTTRVTKLGRALRSLSLDEIPQLINVLLGDMSLVGPRPLPVEYKPYFYPHEQVRHTVPPGITGLAQTSGRNVTSWDERLALDVRYVERRSLALDVAILARTVLQVISRAGVQAVPSEHGARRLDVYRSFPATGGLRLRPLAEEDLPLRVAWMNDATVREQMSVRGTIDESSTAQWFRNHSTSPHKHDFAVVETTTGSVVAMTGISDSANGEGVLYFLTHPNRRGEGIGRAAADLTVRWAFVHRGYRLIRTSVRRANQPSLRIHRGLGFRADGDADDRLSMVLSPGDWVDSA